ncbi:MAG: hypothetical protein V1822_01485 [Candidatus Micrarchaeota archaeon]
MECKKGQYFSFDAIVAAVIFVLAMSILANHWFSLRSQMDEQTLFLQDEALRISDLFLSPGDYNVPGGNPSVQIPWYKDPLKASRAGFGVNGSFEGNLVYDENLDPSISKAADYLVEGNKYEDSLLLMAAGANYYAEFNLSITNPEDFNFKTVSINMPPLNYAIGKKPPQLSDAIKVVRPVAVIKNYQLTSNPLEGRTAYYIGNMTVYVWSASNR